MDINSYNVLVNRKKEAEKELEDVAAESFDLKVRKARAEKIIDAVNLELSKTTNKDLVTEYDVTGH